MVKSPENMTCWVYRKQIMRIYRRRYDHIYEMYKKGCCKWKNNRLLCISIEDRVSSKWQERDLGLTVGEKI